MRLSAHAQLASALAVILCCSCSPEPSSTSTSSAASGRAFVLDKFCNVSALRPSLRQTFLFVDEGALTKSEGGKDFAAKNTGVRDLLMAFGDPAGATQSGATDYRERLTLFLLPTNGGAAKKLFEGCLPALSGDELAESRKKGSAIGDFFTGGKQQELQNEADDFRTRLVSSVMMAAQSAPGDADAYRGELKSSNVVESLRASGRLVQSAEGRLPRIILLSNLARVDLGDTSDAAAARRKGFADGDVSGLDLGRAELHVFLNEGQSSNLARSYAQAFFLAQHANLVTWGGSSASAMPAAPVSVSRFSGEAAYPGGPVTVQVRLAADRNGQLVDSWVVARGTPDQSTPVTGQMTCENDTNCVYRSDDGGFSQIWSASPGGEPEFYDPERNPELDGRPFGGLRNWEFERREDKLTGRVFDPSVDQINDDPSKKDISLTAKLTSDAIF